MSFWVGHGQLIPVLLDVRACMLENEKRLGIGVLLICAQRKLVSAQLPICLVRSASSS